MVRPAHALLPEDLVIVYSKNSAESKKVADYYASKRNVPLSHLVGVNVPDSESIKRAYYEADMIPPVRNAVNKLKLSGHDPAILLVFGIPLRIEEGMETESQKEYEDLIGNKIKEYRQLLLQQGRQLEALMNKGQITVPGYEKQKREALQTNEVLTRVNKTIVKASQYVQKHVSVAERETYMEVVSLLFRMTGMSPIVRNLKNRISSMDEKQKSLLLSANNLLKFVEILNIQLAEIQFRGFTPDKALEVSTIIRMVNGIIGELLFWEAQRGNSKTEMTSASVDSELTLVLVESFQHSKWLLNPFMKDYDKVPGIDFIRRKTVMVSRLDAPSPDLARRLVDDAIETEKNGLTGTLYIDARGLDDDKAKDDYSRFDGRLLRLSEIVKAKSSFPVVLDKKAALFPEKSCTDAALYAGWYSLARYVDSFRWKRGAVGFHIASSEADTLKRKGSQVWCKRMIEEGVAATIGPVSEPYIFSFPLPDVFFPLLMTGKLTLLETYFRCIPHISWRQILIGDPLYTPFKKNPAIELDSL